MGNSRFAAIWRTDFVTYTAFCLALKNRFFVLCICNIITIIHFMFRIHTERRVETWKVFVLKSLDRHWQVIHHTCNLIFIHPRLWSPKNNFLKWEDLNNPRLWSPKNNFLKWEDLNIIESKHIESKHDTFSNLKSKIIVIVGPWFC